MLCSGLIDQLKLLQKVATVYHDSCRPLEHSFTLHKTLEVKLGKEKCPHKHRRPMTKSRPVYTALHSLYLHLQAAMQRQVI